MFNLGVDREAPTDKELQQTFGWVQANIDPKTLEVVDAIGEQLISPNVDITVDIDASFKISQGLIRKIASRYTNLDAAVGIDDLISQSYIGFTDGMRKYNLTQYGVVKFSTILTWYIQKCFQKLCSPAFMAAELVTPDGERKSVHYNEFQKIKRHLPVRLTDSEGGVTYMPLSEFKTKESTLPIGLKIKPTEYNVISTIRSLDYSSSDEDEGNLLDTGIFHSSGEDMDEEDRLVDAIDRKWTAKKAKRGELR